MKISLKWLNDFVKIDDIDPKELSYKISMKTAETEELYIKSEHFKGIYTAKILSAKKIDDSHFLCRVFSDREYQVVSGAPNTREGMLTLFVKPGGMIDDKTIGEKEFSGYASSGMLLSGKEAGINNDHSGIFELGRDIIEGRDIDSICGYYDSTVEIDNKSITHRPDLWGIYGFAREISAIYKRKLNEYPVFNQTSISSLNKFPITVEDDELCFRYVGVAISNIVIAPSPIDIQVRLYNTGHMPKNLIVDLTNYVMTEIGQPLHAFDGSRISGIKVDTLKEDTNYETLDKVLRKLPKGLLMINNEDGPVGIAGIMGGGNSEIGFETDSLFLESATFNPHHIRKMSTQIGLRTDSSSRFEKSLDPENALLGSLRFIYLLTKYQKNVKFASSVTDLNYNPFTRSIINSKYSYIRKFMGCNISDTEIHDILASLSFEVKANGDNLGITAPTYRSTKDISIQEDIVEEVARIYGYDNIEPQLPMQKVSIPAVNRKVEIDDLIRDTLSYNCNMCEADSHPWYDNKFNKKISYKPVLAVEVKNPISKDNTHLRTSMLPTLLKFSFDNLKIFDTFSIYEIGHLFSTGTEKRVLSIMIVDKKVKLGDETLFFKLKQTVTDLYHRITGLQLLFSDPKEHQLINPSISAEIIQSGSDMGYIGVLHPQINSLLDKKVNIVYCEIDMEIFYQKTDETKFKMFSIYPQTILDFSILKPDNEYYEDFYRKISSFKNALITKMKVTAVYSGENITDGYKSITFRFIIGRDDRTLTAEDITDFQSQFRMHIESFDYKLR